VHKHRKREEARGRRLEYDSATADFVQRGLQIGERPRSHAMRCTLQQPISPKAAVGVKLASSTHDAVSPLYTRVTHVCPKWAWCLARGCSVGHAKGCASSEWLAGGFSRSSGLIRSGCHCATCFRLILAAAKQAKCARRHGNLAAQIICTGARRSVIAQPDSHRRPLTARPSCHLRMLYGSCMLLSIVTGCICCLALCRELPYGRSSKRKSTRRRALQVATLLLPRRASPASYVTFFRVRLKSVVSSY
jgi:hypothetical protein